MDCMWEIYENLQEIVYVTDMDTHEVVYINKFGRSRFGVDSMEEIQGKPCYQVLQKCSSPCSICTNSKLKPGQFYEWRYYNALLGRTFLIKDTMIEKDGRRYRLELAVDISEIDAQKKTIKEFTSNETMVNDALRLALAESTPEKSIQVLLKHLGQSLRSDRVYIFEGEPGQPVDNTYEWCAGGVEPQQDFLQNVPFEVVALWYETFEKGENIVIKSLESIRESDPRVYETLLPQQIDSLVVSPLILNDKIIGFYGVDNPPKEYLNHISVMFMVLGYFIASMLRRRNLVDKLERMSYYDQLTGGLNRHGMNKFMEKVNRDASIGIAFCDVMGLKQLNDTQGHPAGDALLVRAYKFLSSVFSPQAVFRVGGDEFLIMCSGISQQDMESRIQTLKDDMEKHDVALAVGCVWQEKCTQPLPQLMKTADTLMYADKAAYYAAHPAVDRRSRRG